MTTKRLRSFTDEFKQETVALLESSGRPLGHIAVELGIQPSMLRNWRRRFAGPGGTPRPSDREAVSPQAYDGQAKEIARLKREVDHPRMEKDIKKNCLHRIGSSEMKFRIVEECREDYPVRVICRALDVSASGYYAWRDRPESPRKAENRRPLGDIQRLYHEHRGRYGSPRIQIALGEEGWIVSRGRVARVMRHHGIQAKRCRAFRVCTTDNNHDLPVAPNLLNRKFSPGAPRRARVADISYIPTDEGWLYLAVVLDLFSRKVVGWAMRDHMHTELPLAVLMMATQRQKPPCGLIHHSDRGSQYAS